MWYTYPSSKPKINIYRKISQKFTLIDMYLTYIYYFFYKCMKEVKIKDIFFSCYSFLVIYNFKGKTQAT